MISTKRIEIILLVYIVFMLMFLNGLQNKFLDLGIDYQVSIIEGITFTAITGFWFGFILYHIGLLSLYTYSILKKGTHYFWDMIFGGLAFFGTAIIMTGAVTGIYTERILFFTFNLAQISFYHIGILFQILAMFYFAFTD